MKPPGRRWQAWLATWSCIAPLFSRAVWRPLALWPPWPKFPDPGPSRECRRGVPGPSSCFGIWIFFQHLSRAFMGSSRLFRAQGPCWLAGFFKARASKASQLLSFQGPLPLSSVLVETLLINHSVMMQELCVSVRASRAQAALRRRCESAEPWCSRKAHERDCKGLSK